MIVWTSDYSRTNSLPDDVPVRPETCSIFVKN